MPRLVIVIFLVIAAGVLALLVATDDESPTATSPGEDAPTVEMGGPDDQSTPEVSPGTQPVTRPGPEGVTVPEGERTPDIEAEEPESPDTGQPPDPAEGEEEAEDEPTPR